MDWVPNLVPFFPTFFRYSTAFNFRKEQFHPVQHILRMISSISLLLYTTYCFAGEDVFSFAMFHDGLFILMFFLAIELSLILKLTGLTTLVNFINEPVKVGQSENKRLTYQKYIKYITIYGIFPPLIVTFYGIVWPMVPGILYMSGYKQFSVDQPIIWMISSESISLAYTALLVVYMASNVSLVQGWFLILTVAIYKLNLLIEFIVEDVTKLDETSDEQCEDLLNKLTTTGRLPLCQGCRERFSDVTRPDVDQLGLSAILHAGRRCCRQACRDRILHYFHTRCLNNVVIQHQKIIRLSRIVDDVFKMSTWSFSQAVVLIVALVIPQLDKLMERSLMESAPAFLEATGGPLFIVHFCYLGQSLLYQSERIRFALYSCHWTSKPQPFRKAILLMLTVANRDLRLTAGGLYNLNLNLLSSFFQSVYGLCKILQFLKLKKETV